MALAERPARTLYNPWPRGLCGSALARLAMRAAAGLECFAADHGGEVLLECAERGGVVALSFCEMAPVILKELVVTRMGGPRESPCHAVLRKLDLAA